MTWLRSFRHGIIILLLIIVSVMSPIFLTTMAKLMGDQDWEKLSFIGQTYGAIAAVVTTLSLLGIVVSLLLQTRALAVQIEQGARSNTTELIRMGLDHPYLIAGGPFPTSVSPAMLYSGLWITHFRALYLLGYMYEAELKLEVELLFKNSPDARERWAYGREAYRSGAAKKREVKFFRIVDAVHGSVARDVAEDAAGSTDEPVA